MGSPNEAAAEPGTGSASVDVSHTTTTTTTTATGAAVNTTPAANNSTDSHSTSSSNGSSSNSHDDPGGSAGVASLKTIHAQANGKASGRISCTTPQPGQQPLPTQSTTIRPATPPPEGLPPPPESSQVTAKASTDGGPEAADADAGDASALCSASSTVSSASGDHYCLRWTNHGSHVLSVFSQLLRDEALVDVTLAAEGQSLRAHKMVLSACSSFFRTLFVSHPERHPIIILKDTKFDELKTLLEYMYKGEVSVEYGQLGTLLKTAENLRVKGLAEVTSNHAAGSARRPDHAAPATDEAMDEDDSDAMDEDVDDQMSPIVLERERLPAVVESEPCHPHRSGRSLYPLSRGYAGRSIYQQHKSGYRHGSGGFGSADGALSRPYSQNHRAHPRSSAAANQDAYVKRHHPRHNHLTHPQHPAEDQQQPPTAANPPESNRIKSDTGPVNGTDLTRRKSPPRQSSGQDRTSPQPTRQSTDQCGSGAEDLRRVAADSPLPPESFRTGTSARPPAATNNIGHFWHGAPMDDESESSESDDCDEFGRLRRSSMAGHEPSLIGRQPPPHFHPTAPGGSSSARLDPPQHFPLPLKKEADWTSVGLNMAPGTSRSDAPASRSPSFSESSSEYGRHADQFSDDQMPTAEVLIEEGDFLSPSLSGGFSSDRECGAGGGAAGGAGSAELSGGRATAGSMSLSSSHRSRRRRRMQFNSQDLHHHHRHHFRSAANHSRSPSDPSEPRSKRFLAFPRPSADSADPYLDETGAEDLSTSPGAPRGGANNNKQDFGPDEVTVSVVPASSSAPAGPSSATASGGGKSGSAASASVQDSPSSFFSSFLPMMAPQFDFSLRFAGLPLNFGTSERRAADEGRASRSGSSTPRPGPSSSAMASMMMGLDADEAAEERSVLERELERVRGPSTGSQRSSSAGSAGLSTSGGMSFQSSISLIESHVGVGYSLGSREKPFKCEQCGQCYKYLSAFTKHKEQNHTARLPGEKPFRCEVCGMQFKYLKSFKKHRLNHAVERLHPVYPRPLPHGIHGDRSGERVNMAEERSVLEMLARPMNDHHHRHHHLLHGSSSAAGGGRDVDDGSPSSAGYRSSSFGTNASPKGVHIKSEVEAVSSCESDDGGAESGTGSKAEGSTIMSQEEAAHQQQQKNTNREASAATPPASSASAQPRQVVCPNCRMKFANEESLRMHSIGCLAARVQQHMSGSSTPNVSISSSVPPSLLASANANDFLSKERKFGADHRTTSPSLHLHEALRQQQAALLAANFIARNAMLPPAARAAMERDLSITASGMASGMSVTMATPTNAMDDGMDVSSEKDNSDVEMDRDESAGSAAGSANKSSNSTTKSPFVSSLPLSLRPPPIPPAPPPPPPPGSGFMQNVFREISAAAASAASAAASAGGPGSGSVQPPPEYDPGRPHLCPFCGKGFRAKENLKLHIRKHTGERPFECEFCGRAFGGKSDMNRHLRIHTGERPYRCDACGKTFARADYLSKHLSTHLV